MEVTFAVQWHSDFNEILHCSWRLVLSLRMIPSASLLVNFAHLKDYRKIYTSQNTVQSFNTNKHSTGVLPQNLWAISYMAFGSNVLITPVTSIYYSGQCCKQIHNENSNCKNGDLSVIIHFRTWVRVGLGLGLGLGLLTCENGLAPTFIPYPAWV